uniref:RNA-directed DNA polymerase, eukaryota, reverse transcriptase zinc-binding domain protein n=1 Tax=Tanacetum cinerariifolium TaxID=118510 RepID=A0A699JAB8_TANCI|nr:RNA-directed DNA polymerase, eukaryota, reverse transcriptase zinc-binding domain protein [Tanacetum cinerariifolium]
MRTQSIFIVFLTKREANIISVPHVNRLHIDMNFLNKINSDQVADLECEVLKEDIKRAVWDCGIDKSPGPDGFTFGFYRWYWDIIENDVVDVVTCFFHQGFFSKGGNSSFVTLILKTLNANMVKDFRLISLIGSMYKIIAKILANRLVVMLGDLVNEVQYVFVADRQILDGPFILNELVQWIKKNKNNLWSLRSILKRLMIRVVDAGLFKGIVLAPSLHLSHMFYADDAIFMGQWSESNIDTIVQVLECFHRALGLRINMSKSKLLGLFVKADKVEQATAKIGCTILKTPFSYLGSKVGGVMSRIHSWKETIEGMVMRLSKWKLKTLSIGGRLTLLKLVWHFITQSSSLWARVIKALHGEDGKIGKKMKSCYSSIWLDIIHEVEWLKSRGIDLIDVASKLFQSGLDFSFRRTLRGGIEQNQFEMLKEKLGDVSLLICKIDGFGRWKVREISRSRRLSGRRTDAQTGAKIFKQICEKSFGEDIGILKTRWNVENTNMTSCNHTTDEMNADLNVFRPLMLNKTMTKYYPPEIHNNLK